MWSLKYKNGSSMSREITKQSNSYVIMIMMIVLVIIKGV